MNISELAVKRPVTVTVFVIGVLVFGFISVSRLSVDLLPNLQLPQVTVATVYPGADPLTIEEEVTRPIEEIVSMTGGLRRITSVSMEHLSLITVEFNWTTNVSAAIEELRAQLAALSLTLPADAQDPLVLQLDLTQLPVFMLGVSVEGDLVDSTERALNQVRPVLEQVPGVAQVSVLGGAEREIQVLYDPAKLEENGLTPAILEQFLQLQNAMVPGGVLEDDGIRYSTRIGNHFTDAQQIRDLVIGESRLPVQGLAALWPPLLHVKDVAEVVDGIKEPTGYARVDGRPTVLVQVLKRPGANTVDVVQGVRAALGELQKADPELGLTVIIDQSGQIVNSLNNLVIFGSIGAVLAVAVLFLFLRSVRSIAVIASAIPLSVVVTLVLLYFADLNINLMTLGGLALGTGMLVDNAIIVLENIFRHRSLGKKATVAAVDGAKEVGSAVLAATLTTVAVFLPVTFLDSFVGQLFKELGLTVTLSLAASLVVALTVVPVMASRLLRAGAAVPAEVPESVVAPAVLAEAAAAQERGNWLMSTYDRLLQKALNKKGLVLGAVVIALAASAALWPRLGMEFLPQMPSRSIFVNIEMPGGTPLSTTDALAREVERRLGEMPELEFVAAQVGQQYHGDLMSLVQGQQTNTIQVFGYVPETVETKNLDGVMADVKARLADLPVKHMSVSNQWATSGSFLSNDIILQVQGADIDAVQRIARDLEERLRDAVGHLGEVRLVQADEQPEVYLAVDQSRALIGGLSTAQISLSVRNALTGVQATQVRQDGQTIPVVVRPHPDHLQSLDDLLNYRVSSPVPLSVTDTTAVRLGNVAEAVEGTAPQEIRRVDGARVVEVHVRPAEANVRSLTRVVNEVIAEFDMPPGMSIRQAGLSELLTESLEGLGTVLLLSLVLVYMVMAAQFESWRYPLIVIVTVPLAAIGALWALFMTGTNIGVASLIGVIMLSGIVVNNGIVLVDYTNILLRRGMQLKDAVVTAARTRLRPVLMTALTTIGGLIPSAIVQEQGVELQGPIAVTVIGGLTVSTLLTLFVVPTLYLLLSRSASPSDDDEDGPKDDEPGGSGSRAPGVFAVLLMAVFAVAAVAAAPAKAQPAFSNLSVLAGYGYPLDEGIPLYMLGAGVESRWGDTDWRVHFASVTRDTPGSPLLDIGFHGSWFRPIALAGYYEVQGSLIGRRDRGDDAFVGAFKVQGDAVLGNITGRIEYGSVDEGFPVLPWDEPPRPMLVADELARRYLTAELVEQPHRELNLLREFQWFRKHDGIIGDNILLASGGEVRTGAGWIMGKVGILHKDRQLMPVFAGGFRLRPGPYTYFAVTASSPTALMPYPAVTADFEYIGLAAAYTARLEFALDENEEVQPTVFFQRDPHSAGFRWNVSFGSTHSEQRAMVGVFTSF